MSIVAIDYHEGFRDDFKEYLPSNPKKILEIGAGNGGFRRNFGSDIEYWVVEPDVGSANEARKIVDHVLIGTYAEVEDNIPDDYFDLIVCNDVIEHMADWRVFLRKIPKKLQRQDSCLVASIPNIRYFHALFRLLVRKDWPYANSGIFDVTHVAFFTLKSLTRELIEANLNINKIQLEHRFQYTKDQNWFKYIFTVFFIMLLGSDSAYSHIYFVCSKGRV